MLTFEGGIIIFKTLAISKTVYLALITNVSKVIVEELLVKNAKGSKNTVAKLTR